MSTLELKLPPLVLTLLTGAVMWIVSSLLPETKYRPSWGTITTLMLFCAGILFVFLGAYEFKKAKTSLDPRAPNQSSKLVTSGVYRLSRNPIYIGFFSILLAWFFYLSQNHLFVFPVLFVFYMNRFQISPEERFLDQLVGEQYAAYKKQVRRWL